MGASHETGGLRHGAPEVDTVAVENEGGKSLFDVISSVYGGNWARYFKQKYNIEHDDEGVYDEEIFDEMFGDLGYDGVAERFRQDEDLKNAMERVILKKTAGQNEAAGAVDNETERLAESEASVDVSWEEILRGGMQTLREKYNLDDKELSLDERRRYEKEYMAFGAQYLVHLGYEADMVAAMMSAATGAISMNGANKTCLGFNNLLRYLAGCARAMEAIGVDGVNLLHETCGILSFSRYDAEALKRQIALIEGDEAVVREFQDPQNAATVHVTDGVGDWNGAFGSINNYKPFKGYQANSLVFEVGTSNQSVTSELRQYNSILKTRNVHYSTLVVGGHGDENGILFGGESLYASHNPNGREGLTWDDSSVADLLRGVSEDSAGNRNIVIQSCSQGRQDLMVLESIADVASRKASGDAATRVYGVSKPSNIGESYNYSVLSNSGDVLEGVHVREGRMERVHYGGGVAVLDEARLKENLVRYYERLRQIDLQNARIKGSPLPEMTKEAVRADVLEKVTKKMTEDHTENIQTIKKWRKQ